MRPTPRAIIDEERERPCCTFTLLMPVQVAGGRALIGSLCGSETCEVPNITVILRTLLSRKSSKRGLTGRLLFLVRIDSLVSW